MIKEEKIQLREKIWKILESNKIARFPLPCYHRIPNYEGSDKAAEKVRDLEEYQNAKVIVSNPDYAQKKVRELSLRDNKTLIMASPRLKHGYLEIKPNKVKGKEDFVSTIKGAFKYGKRLEDVPKPDLIVTGCVAVDREGNRLGKGGGYGDKEIMFFKLKFGDIPVVTTVHNTQIVDEVPTEKGDLKVDIIVTPKTVIRTSSTSLSP